MIVLGIDPGTASTGYAIVEINGGKGKYETSLVESKVVSTKPGVPMHKRLHKIYEGLFEIADAHTPDIMVVEKLFFNTNAKTAISVGQARGIALLVAAAKSMKVYEYTALQAKLALTGYGRSNKKEMQEAVRKYMKLKEIIKPDDANDAVAMALCYLHKDLSKDD